MNGFDDLLDEVLKQDGNQQLPPGMKHRLLASRPRETTSPNFLQAGMAAGVLIGVVGISAWTMAHIKGGTTVTGPVDAPVLRSPDPEALTGAVAPRLSSSARRPTSSRQARLTRPRSQQRPIQIAPLVIDSLVIEPIKIAPIIPAGSTKGTSR